MVEILWRIVVRETFHRNLFVHFKSRYFWRYGGRWVVDQFKTDPRAQPASGHRGERDPSCPGHRPAEVSLPPVGEPTNRSPCEPTFRHAKRKSRTKPTASMTGNQNASFHHQPRERGTRERDSRESSRRSKSSPRTPGLKLREAEFHTLYSIPFILPLTMRAVGYERHASSCNNSSFLSTTSSSSSSSTSSSSSSSFPFLFLSLLLLLFLLVSSCSFTFFPSALCVLSGSRARTRVRARARSRDFLTAPHPREATFNYASCCLTAWISCAAFRTWLFRPAAAGDYNFVHIFPRTIPHGLSAGCCFFFFFPPPSPPPPAPPVTLVASYRHHWCRCCCCCSPIPFIVPPRCLANSPLIEHFRTRIWKYNSTTSGGLSSSSSTSSSSSSSSSFASLPRNRRKFISTVAQIVRSRSRDRRIPCLSRCTFFLLFLREAGGGGFARSRVLFPW